MVSEKKILKDFFHYMSMETLDPQGWARGLIYVGDHYWSIAL